MLSVNKITNWICPQAPQFITFNDGKLGVNFGGYHAAVGLGGLLGELILTDNVCFMYLIYLLYCL